MRRLSGHRVLQSGFRAPCAPAPPPACFDSGYHAVGLNGTALIGARTATWLVADSARACAPCGREGADEDAAAYFYCEAGPPNAPHCLAGMVGAINARQTDLDDYRARAQRLRGLPNVSARPRTLAVTGFHVRTSAFPAPARCS